MYDGAVFDSATGQLEVADVGLLSLYIADCDALANIAQVLGKSAEEKELLDRADHYRAALNTLWDDQTGMYLNKDLHTGQLSHRLSPTNFYPLLARAATPEQANRMIHEHLLNPNEFWGRWVIPSISRSDPAFKDQQYWRGRIWGPMNYLVYLGLRNYNVPEVRRQFARKSLDLFLGEWLQKGHVHENYNAITGCGDDVSNSDRFYHWGALLGYIQYLEASEPASSMPGAPPS
jgi:neutral trehalase